MELYSPQIQVNVGQYAFSKGIELEINSCEDTYYDWARLRFAVPMEQKLTVARRDKAQIRLGYNGDFSTVFTGYATNDFTSGSNGNEIILKDGMLLLEDARINNTFVQTTPQEIIQYAANLAGITQLQLDPAPYQPIGCLPIFSTDGIRAIKSLGGYWGISPKFYFQDDTLCWGAAFKQSKLCHFEYGKNIISLQLVDGYWELTTVSVPFVKHSQQIKVTSPKITGTFAVNRVRVTTKPQGFIRTILYFKGATTT